MARLYKTNRNVSAYPNIKRMYYNNAKKLKALYIKLEEITLYGYIGIFATDKQDLKNKIDMLLDIQLAIREQAFTLIPKEVTYKKLGTCKRMKKNYISSVSLALESKVK